jgi:hypothetical protein
MQITAALLEAGGNIEDLARTGSDPLKVVLTVSGISADIVQKIVDAFDSDSDFSLTSGFSA